MPVCSGFKPKLIDGDVCYSLRIEKGENITFSEGRKNGLTLLIDLNQERSTPVPLNKVKKKTEDTKDVEFFPEKVVSSFTTKMWDSRILIGNFNPHILHGGGTLKIQTIRYLDTLREVDLLEENIRKCQSRESLRANDIKLIMLAGSKCGCLPFEMESAKQVEKQ